MEAPEINIAHIDLTERQYFILRAVRDLPSPDRYASRVGKAADLAAGRTKPSNPAPQQNAINRLEKLGLISSERDQFSTNRGLPRRWLSVTSLGNAVLEFYKDYKFHERYVRNESNPS